MDTNLLGGAFKVTQFELRLGRNGKIVSLFWQMRFLYVTKPGCRISRMPACCRRLAQSSSSLNFLITREPPHANGEQRSWRRAEQNVQAEGAQRLNGMSGHERPKRCGMGAVGSALAHATRCGERSVLRQRRRAKQKKRLPFAMPSPRRNVA